MHFPAILAIVLALTAYVHGAGIATITLSPASSAGLTARSAPTTVPAGSISAIPDDGLDIYLSSDAQTAVNNAIKANCADPSTEKCQSSIAQALNSKSLQANQLQPRAAGLILAGLVGLLAIVIADARTATEHYHLSPAELSQVSNIASASSVVAVPASKGSTTVFTLPPSATTASAVPTISIDASSGDLHIELTNDLASNLMTMMQLPGTCLGNAASDNADSGASKVRRAASGDSSSSSCIVQDANALMNNAFTGLALAFRFFNPPHGMPAFADPAIEQARAGYLTRWEAAAPAFGVTHDRMDNIATLAFDLSYIWNNEGVDLGTDNVVPGSLPKGNKLHCPSQGNNPEDTNLVCALPSCAGSDRDKICTKDPWKGCRCLIFQPLQNYENYNMDMIRDQPDALTQLLAGPPPDPPSPLTCYSATHPNGAAYITPDTAYAAYKSYCPTIKPASTWDLNNAYNKGTPDYFSLSISGDMPASQWYTDFCNKAFDAILTNCDGIPSNPMNWKQGGEYKINGLTFTIKPLFSNRVWPPPKSPSMSCTGAYKVYADDFGILGSGWASSDWGQKTLFPAISKCVGSNPTGWKFEYYLYDGTPSDHFGFEWHASFNTPIWTRARCFDNCKVSGWAGGPGVGNDCPGCGGDG